MLFFSVVKILQMWKKEQNNLLFMDRKAFHTSFTISPLFGDKVDDPPWGEVKSRPSDYFITAVAAIVVDSIKLGRIHPQWQTSAPQRDSTYADGYKLNHLTRRKKNKTTTNQQLLLFAIVRMQRTTKSRSKTFLAVWWRMRDTGKCLCTFFWRHQSQWEKSFAAGSHSVHVCCCVTVWF